ncbi:FAD dependent oxidoreductase [Vibrio sp. B1FLJ16]|uniref:NAD(P)/FAD-dependent oxidoreductase n=1 Tax=Vibrio sp. B1FLJ16 TaxID=2751178 RepID=UPI0015F5730C|nr:FAD-dependent oxidoreductase [Vibrio sp. B1FLJ16]CAD7820988.1 FAD dependent oxidoreductase [Vibrio sp. B1FLJ16]CAE6944912.1 FAD dependent oxidoreductase [Vibrio sp. B1FLJ16]
MKPEYIVVGGGVVGCAVSYGLLKAGHKVTVLDGGDSAHRASRGNFGLVWLSSKGLDAPHYAAWTRRSVNLWRGLADELEQATGEDLNLQQQGGYDFHFSEKEMMAKATQYESLRKALGTDHPYEVWNREQLIKEDPYIGPDVIGAIFGPEDGHVNPLKLLKAYTKAIQVLGANLVTGVTVNDVIKQSSGKFQVTLDDGTQYQSDKVILSAGLGASTLGPKLGFVAPISPQKGQVLITEKLPPTLKRPSGIIRQVDEGGIQIGDSKENAGFDDSDTVDMTAAIAERAIAVYPFLAQTKLVRSWGAIRIISPDGLPIYQQSKTNSGAYLVSCHSGITLAAAHSYLLPHWLEQTADAPNLELFSEDRF